MTDLLRHRRSVAPLLVGAVLAAMLGLLSPASADAAKTSNCAKEIINDWYDNNRVDKIYKPLSCYTEAIRALPVDVRIYAEAEDDILRALAFARKSQPDPGDVGTPTTPTTTTTTPEGPGGPGSSGTDTTPTTGETAPPSSVDTSGPSAIPLPLILLAGLSLLLLAAGGAGYLNRRAEARRNGSPDDDLS